MSDSVRTGGTVGNDRPTVHVIDDDVSPREALGLLLPSVGFDVRTYEAVQEFIAAGPHGSPGCIVLDVRMPGIDGLSFQSRREKLGIRLPVVLMTGHSDIPMAVRAMKAGAVDFLPKPFRDQDMIDAVIAAIQRDRERCAADRVAAEFRDRYARLSPREQQVMTLMTVGKMSKQIAFDLGLNVQTVKAHRCAVMQKMAAQTLTELVRMADALALHATGLRSSKYLQQRVVGSTA